MPMQRKRYPVNWPAVARSLKEAVDWTCQECGIECRRPGQPYVKGMIGWRLTLTVAHVEPESQAPDAEIVCVMILCSECHARFDAEKQAERARRYRRRHQMSLGTFWARQSKSQLAPEEVADLAAAWPAMPDGLEGGVDWWAEHEIVGMEETNVASHSN